MRILITSIMDVGKTAPNRLHHFVRHLSQNHDITILSINQWWKAEQANTAVYDRDFKRMLQNTKVKYFTERRASPIWQEMWSVMNRERLLKEINYNSVGVHLNYSSLVSGYFIAKRLKSIGIGTVYDIADDLPQMIKTSPVLPSLLRPPAKIVGSIIIRQNIALASKVTFINHSLRDSYSVPQSKSELIPNGVDIEAFKPYPSHHVREKLGLHQSFVIGYVGSLREWVDLGLVFATVKQLGKSHPDIKVLVVGEEGKFKQNRDLAREYAISDRVVFTGAVPYDQVPHFISCMDICLIPFKTNAVSQNALPLKLFEYMACEKPVVSTRLRGVMEAVKDRVLYASDGEELAQRIRELYANVQLRIKMGLESRRFVERNYSWRTICGKLEKVLLEVASLKNKS